MPHHEFIIEEPAKRRPGRQKASDRTYGDRPTILARALKAKRYPGQAVRIVTYELRNSALIEKNRLLRRLEREGESNFEAWIAKPAGVDGYAVWVRYLPPEIVRGEA